MNINKKSYFVGPLMFFCIIIGAIVIKNKSASVYIEVEETSHYTKYVSEKTGFTFLYPQTYFLEEKNLNTPQREHHAIILTEDTAENRLVREGKSPGREGPVAITVDVYQNLEDASVSDWIQTHGGNASNWKLDGRNLTQISIQGKEAFSYNWSGLYEARSVVFAHKGNIIMTTVTYITSEDTIISVFENILTSFIFID